MKLKPIRWTVEKASAEFSISRVTLSKYIKAKGVVPGDDGKFSTMDICRAVFTDGEKARAELAESQKENFELKNRKLADKLADCALFQQISDGMVLILRQKISDAQIPSELKTELLKEIQKIDVDEVVKTNSKPDNSDLEEESEVG